MVEQGSPSQASVLRWRWKRLILWIGLSALGILAMVFLGLPQFAPRKTRGDWYWHDLLGGGGLELKRDNGRMHYFTSDAKGWSFWWTTEAEIEAAMVPEVRRHIDEWLAYRRATVSGEIALDPCERSLFKTLTGYHIPDQAYSVADWWKANRRDFVPSRERVLAYLQARKGAALRGHVYVPHERWLYDDKAEVRMENWISARNERIRLNFTFEGAHFSLLMAFFTYTLPWISRKLVRRGWYRPARYALVAFLVHCGVVFPYVFGYSPNWLTSAQDQGTIVYNFFLFFAELPRLLCGVHPFYTFPDQLDSVFPGFLRFVNDPGAPRSCEPVHGAAEMLLIGGAFYAAVGCLLGLAGEVGGWSRRKRDSRRTGITQEVKESDKA